jgi:hypothetical protein
MNDNDLIQAIYDAETFAHQGRVLDCDTAYFLRKAAERLAELTQPQPIETAPKDGTRIFVLGGDMGTELNYYGSPNLGTLVSYREIAEESPWQIENTCYYGAWVKDPTHWLPCVKVDPSSLGGVNEK